MENRPLTVRQDQIIRYIGQDFTDAEIADKLNVTDQTFDFEMQPIRSKFSSMGANTFARLAIANGWITRQARPASARRRTSRVNN